MKSYKKTILITGGAGFIGSHIVRYFVKRYPEYLIINFDALTYAGNLENLKDIEGEPNYIFIHGDITSMGGILKRHEDEPHYCEDGNIWGVANVFNKYRITDVIHLAAESHVDRSIKYPTVFFDTNVMGTLNLLNIAKEKWEGSDGERNVFINFSTDEIFGHLTSVDDKPFNETTPLSPRSPYATSKASQTMIGYTYYNTYNVPVINTTCGNIIGSHQFPEKLVPLTIDKIINNEKIPIYGEGAQRRDWTDVRDVCYAVDKIFHEGKLGEMYCISGDGECSNLEIVNKIIENYARIKKNYLLPESNLLSALIKRKIEFIPDPRGNAHDFRYKIDHSKLSNELKWYPNYELDRTLQEIIKWYIDNQDWVKHCKNGEYRKWIAEQYK